MNTIDHFNLILSQLPGWDESQIQVRQVPDGWSNENLIISLPTCAYFVRIGNESLGKVGVDLKREYACATLAADQGFAPRTFLYDESQRLFVTAFIPSARPIEKQSSRIINLLKNLHSSSIVFPTIFCPYSNIFNYYETAIQLGVDSQPLFFILPLVKEIQRVAPSFRTLRPCHLDLYEKNFIDDGEKIWLVDWEYAAMADPLCDLACFMSANQCSDDEMKEILAVYSSEEDFSFLYQMTILADIRWSLWSFIQARTSSLPHDYAGCAHHFLKRAFEKARQLRHIF